MRTWTGRDDVTLRSLMLRACTVRQASKLAYGSEEIPGNRADIVRLLSSAPEGAAFIVPNEHHAIVTVELQGNVDEKDEPSILEDVKRAIE